MHPGQFRLLADTVKTGEAKVKVSGVPLVLRFCNYGESVSVLESATAPEIPGYTAILESDGTTAYTPTAWLEDHQAFTPWQGYAGNNCKLYEHYLLLGKEVRSLYTNKPLTVLWDTGLTALVQVDGERFYAASTTLRQTPWSPPPPRKAAAAAPPAAPAAAATCGPHRHCNSQSPHKNGTASRTGSLPQNIQIPALAQSRDLAAC